MSARQKAAGGGVPTIAGIRRYARPFMVYPDVVTELRHAFPASKITGELSADELVFVKVLPMWDWHEQDHQRWLRQVDNRPLPSQDDDYLQRSR